MLKFTHELQCQFKTFVIFHFGLNEIFAFQQRTGCACKVWQSVAAKYRCNEPTIPLKKYRLADLACCNTP